jgi:hypothetical protein
MSPEGDDDGAAVFGNFVVVVVADIVASRTLDIDVNHRMSVHVHEPCHAHEIFLSRNLLAALFAVADGDNCNSDLELLAVVVVHVTMCVDSLAAILED